MRKFKEKIQIYYDRLKMLHKFNNPLSVAMFKLGVLDECLVKFKDDNINNFVVNDENSYLLDLYSTISMFLDLDKYDDFCNLINSSNSNNMYVEVDGLKFWGC